MAYDAPHYSTRPTGDFPMGRGSDHHQPKPNNPANLIDDIFVPTGDICSQGRGKEREGRGEWLQGPAGRREEKSWIGRMERGRSRTAARQGRYKGEEDDRAGKDTGGDGVW